MASGNGHRAGHNGAHSGFYVLEVDTKIEKEDALYTAYADQLELAAVGDSEDEALENLRQTVIVWCRMREKRGVLEKALNRAGVKWESVDRIETMKVPIPV